jgi:5-dehydro-4-deoxyglucarate dehydratase
MDFYRAVSTDDHVTMGRLLDQFFLPFLAIRNRMPGYAVSIIKAGARIVGHDAGPVRPPLVDLTAAESAQLAALIQGLGPQ